MHGTNKTIRILHKIDFTSERKRMSVVVEFNHKVAVFTKGADSEVLSRLGMNLMEHSEQRVV